MSIKRSSYDNISPFRRDNALTNIQSNQRIFSAQHSKTLKKFQQSPSSSASDQKNLRPQLSNRCNTSTSKLLNSSAFPNCSLNIPYNDSSRSFSMTQNDKILSSSSSTCLTRITNPKQIQQLGLSPSQGQNISQYHHPSHPQSSIPQQQSASQLITSTSPSIQLILQKSQVGQTSQIQQPPSFPSMRNGNICNLKSSSYHQNSSSSTSLCFSKKLSSVNFSEPSQKLSSVDFSESSSKCLRKQVASPQVQQSSYLFDKSTSKSHQNQQQQLSMSGTSNNFSNCNIIGSSQKKNWSMQVTPPNNTNNNGSGTHRQSQCIHTMPVEDPTSSSACKISPRIMKTDTSHHSNSEGTSMNNHVNPYPNNILRTEQTLRDKSQLHEVSEEVDENNQFDEVRREIEGYKYREIQYLMIVNGLEKENRAAKESIIVNQNNIKILQNEFLSKQQKLEKENITDTVKGINQKLMKGNGQVNVEFQSKQIGLLQQYVKNLNWKKQQLESEQLILKNARTNESIEKNALQMKDKYKIQLDKYLKLQKQFCEIANENIYFKSELQQLQSSLTPQTESSILKALKMASKSNISLH